LNITAKITILTQNIGQLGNQRFHNHKIDGNINNQSNHGNKFNHKNGDDMSSQAKPW
jgi:hypothetical protein